MHLVKVLCNTDWKSRADHDVTILATGDYDTLRKEVDRLAREVFVDGLVDDKRGPLEDKGLDEDEIAIALAARTRTVEKLKDDKLKEKWVDEPHRWEMNVTNKPGEYQRLFVWDDGEGCIDSLSYSVVPSP